MQVGLWDTFHRKLLLDLVQRWLVKNSRAIVFGNQIIPHILEIVGILWVEIFRYRTIDRHPPDSLGNLLSFPPLLR